MIYENQVLVFPLGMKTNANKDKTPHYDIHIKNSKIKAFYNRRKTLKIGNAIRLKEITEDTTFDNCIIFLEGTMTKDKIEPSYKHKCCVYASEVN